MKKATIASISAGVVVAIILVVFFVAKPTERYSLSLDPFIDQQTLVTNTHVTVQNTGSEPLTNVRVDYGDDSKPDIIPVLNPGDKLILSPPSNSNLEQVTVTTDQGISVTKPYRSAPKMVGMMGS
ncbi:MAG: hypothetical protein E6K91_01540 [Thaumarchaeota archaeon]|nr:MAG: hypothetical protein E6K91_01540 [Nitrososphaerota archaeon]